MSITSITSQPGDSPEALPRQHMPGNGLATVTSLSSRRPLTESASNTRGVMRRLRAVGGSDAGMATAEYAIVTLAAVGFAGLMVLILQSGEVRGMLMSLIQRALTFG